MIEFIVVPRPTFTPNACVACMGIGGPMADTHRELPVNGHVYVCQGCAKRLARVFGFAKGKRMDELADADRLLAAAQLEIERKDGEIFTLRETVADRDRRIESQTEEIAILSQRNAQLVAALKDEANALAAVAGD